MPQHLSLRDEFLDAIVQWRCRDEDVRPPLAKGMIDWSQIDGHHLGPMQEMVRNAQELADKLIDVVGSRFNVG